MGRVKNKKRELPIISGKPGIHGMAHITQIQMGDELAGGTVVAILWYTEYRAFIICEHKKYWNIHHYRSDTKKRREFDGHYFWDNLYTYKILSKKDFDLKNLLSKLISKIKF